MRIRELADKLGISTDAIRYWEKRGLLSPPRSPNGYRDYGEDDYRRLVLIGYAKEAGFTLAQIGSALDAAMREEATFQDLSGILDEQRLDLDRRIRDLSRMKSRISEILEGCPRNAKLGERLFGEGVSDSGS
jgi:DNA-binding transcriptional MerR regulator